MATIWMTGGEWGVSEFDFGGSPVVAGFGVLSPRSGTYVYRINYTDYYKRLPGGPYQELFCQLAFGTGGFISGAQVFGWKAGSALLGHLVLNSSTRILDVYIGSTKVGSCPQVIQAWTWYVIEVHIKIADSGGILEVRIDGNPQLTFVGDTKPDANTAIDTIGNYVAVNNEYFYDDFIVNDPTGEVNNSWPGGLKIALRKPVAEGPVQQWLPTPGPDHYTALDETPPSGADYVKTDVVDNIEMVQLSALPAEAQSVKAVQLDAWCLKASTVPPTRLALLAQLAGIDYVQPIQDLPLAQGQIKTILNTNPAGGNWTVAATNALILGAQAKA